MNIKEKILGCLIGAATGDAMGGPTETRTRKQIEEKFNGYVDKFFSAPADVFARGNKPGQVTDDFSVAYVTCKKIIENNGVVNDAVAKDSLLEWSKDMNYFDRFAGPTSRAGIEALRNNSTPPLKYGFNLVTDNEKSTNGASMKASPIALLSNGNVDLAIKNAMIISRVTHNNNVALSAAAAVASATSKALQEDSTLESLLDAAIYGAKKGDEYGRKYGETYANPSFLKKMKLAISIGYCSNSLSKAIDEIVDIIGTGVYAYESVAAAFGLMVAANGDTLQGIYAGVNAGNDTDSVATIIGGILGALNGSEVFPEEYVNIINQANGYNLQKLTGDIFETISKEQNNG